MKRIFTKMLFVFLMLVMMISVVPMAQADIADGDYVFIYTKEDLDNVRNDLGGNYILMNDIVFTDDDFEVFGDFYNNGMGWLPIGGEFSKYASVYNEFTGVFDGNGYSISNIRMNRTPNTKDAYPERTVLLPDGTKQALTANHSFGLFAHNAGTIKNLNISVDFNVTAEPNAVLGGICGINSGAISGCKVSGKLFAEKTTDDGDAYLGGIAGLSGGGTIKYSVNNAEIGGSNPYYFPYINCGGIIGGSMGFGENIISCCYNTGNINTESASDGHLGGIAARTSYGGVFYNGFSLTIENCYNAGTIGSKNNSSKISGICAEGDCTDINIINCYNTGSVLSSRKTAGIVYGQNRSSNCYYLDTSADSLWCSYWGSSVYTVNALQKTEMKTEEAFDGFDFDNIWIIDLNSAYSYPQLKNNRQSEPLPESHNYAEVITKPASCTQNGKKVLTCTDCGKVVEEEITATGHSYNSSVTVPTCTSKGFTTYICKCGDSYIADFVEKDKNNHSGETEIRDKVKESCVENGYTGDTYCLSCNTRIETGTVIIAVGKHNYVSDVTTPATHLKEGVETFTCPCGDTYTKPLAKLAGHTYEESVTEPTCTAQGYTAYTCACGDTYTADYSAMLTHKYDNACDMFCNVCFAYRSISHSYETTTIKATLSENGSIKTVCTVCSDVQSTQTINFPKTFTLSSTNYTFNGYIRKPTVTVKDSAGKVLVNGTDYTVTYDEGRKNVGTYDVTVTMKGNYTGTKTISFTIKPIDISKCTVKLSYTSTTYNGSVKAPTVTVTNASGTKLTNGTSYTVTYDTGRKNVGTYNVKVTMKGNYTGTKTLSFKIKPMDISDCTVKLSSTSLTYNAKVRTPSVTVTNANGVKLTKDTHYTVTYDTGRRNVGTYNVKVTLKGNYTGTKTLSFKIKSMDISKCTVKLSSTSLTYNGNVRKPTVTVINANGVKLKDTHYTVTYASGRKNVGTYNVKVTMKGNYTGTKTLSFKIKPINISTCTVKLSATVLTYNGNVRKPTVTVTNSYGTKLTKDKHYTVSYASGRKNVGTYKVTVKMIGNYTGTKILTFKINPPKTTISKLTAGTKKITVNLTKKTTQVTGYQIQYSTSKDFTNAKTKTLTNSTVKTTLSGLKANKTYYVRVRTYKTVNDVKYYSGWSAYKYVKTK